MSVPTDLRTCELCGDEWEHCECVCSECGQAPCECGQDEVGEVEAFDGEAISDLPTAEEYAAGVALADAMDAGEDFRADTGRPVQIMRVARTRLRKKRRA